MSRQGVCNRYRKIKTYLYCFLFSVLVPFQVSAAEKVIVFLGDSLTAGYGLPEQVSFPSRIQHMLQQDHLSWRVINAGVSGDTTTGGLQRLDWVMKGNPDSVFIALGANDGLRGIDLSISEANLRQMIERLQAAQVQIILAGNLLPINYGEPYREQFQAMYTKLANAYKIPFYPFLLEGVATLSEYNLDDGVHPNAEGYAIIAQKVYSFLQPLLGEEHS